MNVATGEGAMSARLAELDEERAFLLGSLSDLEKEHDAGDVDDLDYQTLKDGYTVRAAAVLREIEAGKAQHAESKPRRWGRTLMIAASIVAVSVGIGFVLAGAWGERSAGQEITGLTPGDESRILLTNARDSLGTGDFETSNALFAEVIQNERDRGRESAEALAYFGWTLALITRQHPDDPQSPERLDAAKIALAQAAEIEPDYADPECFLAIIEYRFLDDAEAALPHVDRCQGNNPPAEISTLVSGFADEIRAAN